MLMVTHDSSVASIGSRQLHLDEGRSSRSSGLAQLSRLTRGYGNLKP
jgi:ABC-type lipoprotein export system ATPase subunit